MRGANRVRRRTLPEGEFAGRRLAQSRTSLGDGALSGSVKSGDSSDDSAVNP
jgi:hypothetical protein